MQVGVRASISSQVQHERLPRAFHAADDWLCEGWGGDAGGVGNREREDAGTATPMTRVLTRGVVIVTVVVAVVNTCCQGLFSSLTRRNGSV